MSLSPLTNNSTTVLSYLEAYLYLHYFCANTSISADVNMHMWVCVSLNAELDICMCMSVCVYYTVTLSSLS